MKSILRGRISRIWKTDSVLSCYCIDEDPSEQRRRNVEAKTHNFSRPKMRGGCGSLLYSWDIVAVEGLRLLLGIWILLWSFGLGSLEMSKFWRINECLENRAKMPGGCGCETQPSSVYVCFCLNPSQLINLYLEKLPKISHCHFSHKTLKPLSVWVCV